MKTNTAAESLAKYEFPENTEEARSIVYAVMRGQTNNMPAWYQGREADAELLIRAIVHAVRHNDEKMADIADAMATCISGTIRAAYRIIMLAE